MGGQKIEEETMSWLEHKEKRDEDQIHKEIRQWKQGRQLKFEGDKGEETIVWKG